MDASRSRRTVRRVLCRAGMLTTLPLLTTAVWLLAAGPTIACSCVMPGPMKDYATADILTPYEGGADDGGALAR